MICSFGQWLNVKVSSSRARKVADENTWVICCNGYGGANVSLITKTSGNAFHGALFEFVRNDDAEVLSHFR